MPGPAEYNHSGSHPLTVQGGLDGGISAAPLGTHAGSDGPSVEGVPSVACLALPPPVPRTHSFNAEFIGTVKPNAGPPSGRHQSPGQCGKDCRRDKYGVHLTWPLPSFGIRGFWKEVPWTPRVVQGLPESCKWPPGLRGRWDWGLYAVTWLELGVEGERAQARAVSLPSRRPCGRGWGWRRHKEVMLCPVKQRALRGHPEKWAWSLWERTLLPFLKCVFIDL